ncbi:MAG: hypothetical protein ABI405_05465 [Parafilimonas sp.]
MNTVLFKAEERKVRLNSDKSLKPHIAFAHHANLPKSSLLQRLFKYAEGQEEYKFGWVGISLFVHGCILAPITIICIAFSGNSLVLWLPCILAFVITEIVNLSAMPTKITIPVLLGSVIVDILIIAIALFLMITH